MRLFSKSGLAPSCLYPYHRMSENKLILSLVLTESLLGFYMSLGADSILKGSLKYKKPFPCTHHYGPKDEHFANAEYSWPLIFQVWSICNNVLIQQKQNPDPWYLLEKLSPFPTALLYLLDLITWFSNFSCRSFKVSSSKPLRKKRHDVLAFLSLLFPIIKIKK